MNIVILGQTITSSWHNGHATTYRGLLRELNNLGHQVLFLEREAPLFATHRDLGIPAYCQLGIYTSQDDLKAHFTEQVREADLVILGSGVPEGVQVGEWVVATARGIKAFYDHDTPETLAKLEREEYDYLHPNLIPKYDLYLSSAGGPTPGMLEHRYGSPMARPFYASFDPTLFNPVLSEIKWDLGYLGAYAASQQEQLGKLMLDAAQQWPQGRFVVAGSDYPESIEWPENMQQLQHLEIAEQKHFYNSQRFTLNISSPEAIKIGYAPSAHLFEAAACCTPVISEYWNGLERFFKPGEEILVARSAKDTLCYLREICKSDRKMIGERARRKVLRNHTPAHRAQQLVNYAGKLVTVDKPQPAVMSVG